MISLFHVMSYQTTNADLLAVFATAAAHLRPGGLFLFRFLVRARGADPAALGAGKAGSRP